MRPVRASLTFHCFLQLPLQGALVVCIRLPRAVPWAVEILGFQPALFGFDTPSQIATHIYDKYDHILKRENGNQQFHLHFVDKET